MRSTVLRLTGFSPPMIAAAVSRVIGSGCIVMLCLLVYHVPARVGRLIPFGPHARGQAGQNESGPHTFPPCPATRAAWRGALPRAPVGPLARPWAHRTAFRCTHLAFGIKRPAADPAARFVPGKGIIVFRRRGGSQAFL